MMDAAIVTIDEELRRILVQLRARRAFDAQRYVDAKCALIDEYARRTGIRACVVGVSGGIDSAVTLGLLMRAASRPRAAIDRVIAVLSPMFVDHGATHQDIALARGREVATRFCAEMVVVDLSKGFEAVRADVERGLGTRGEPWAAGQLVSYLRTPAFYYVTALLCEAGMPAILVGTTNRDEGAYIGFFGKASDGMVDLQALSDAHKSEVRALARHLGVPESVIEATPSGDTYDGRSDEAMMGIDYELLELVQLMRCAGDTVAASLLKELGEPSRARLAEASARIEVLHAKNRHKYLGASPAVHLDVMDRAVEGGWPKEARPIAAMSPSPRGPFAARFELPSSIVEQIVHGPRTARDVTREIIEDDVGDAVRVIDGVLSPDECEALLRAFDAAPHAVVGIDGRLASFDAERHALVNLRASVFDAALADALYERLRLVLPPLRTLDAYSSTDHDDHAVWRARGLNTLFRFVAYENGGALCAHHDSTFDLGDGRRRTLMSVILSLTEGGATRLLVDSQRHLPRRERIFEDAPLPAADSDVLNRIDSRRGRALIFDHRIFHDAPSWTGPGRRVLLRTDLVFERCGVPLPPRSKRALVPVPKKVERDPYYREVYEELGSLRALEHAGFFDDRGPDEPPRDGRRDASWLVTPLDAVRRRLALAPPSAPLAVLLSTGAFCPVHRGHLSMMERARAALEERGVFVLGGFLSPGHDAYVDTKCAAENPGAAERVRLVEQATMDSDWLRVDPFEALHTDVAVNFTDVIVHLEAYLSRHLRCHRRVEVAYVFGGDNARFALTFLCRGRCVVIARPGYESSFRETFDAMPKNDPRIVFVGDAADDAASARIRAGDESSLPAPIREAWRSLSAASRGEAGTLFVRRDLDWALAPWADRENFAAAREEVEAAIEATLRAAFDDRAVRIEHLQLEAQRARAASFHATKTLSLDPCIEGTANLAVSRRFGCASAAAPSLSARPGSPSLPEQLCAIDEGEYALFDDDIATGFTIEALRAALGTRIRVTSVHALADLRAHREQGFADLVDQRDLLVGARGAGVTIELFDGSLARVPVAWPYVSPTARMGMAAARQAPFSRALWALNLAFFERLRPTLCLRDADVGFRALGDYLGFAPDMALAEICRWHLARSGV